MDGLIIKANTKLGYVFVPMGGVFDGSYPTSKTRRGRVQEGGKICPTIATTGELYVLVRVEGETLQIPPTDVREFTLSNG